MSKHIKAIKTMLIVLTIATLMCFLVVSQDEHHLETCDHHHCFYCAIIHIAQIILNLSIVIIIAAFIGFLIFLFLSRLYKQQQVFIQSSLVFQKVQLND